MYEGTCTKCSTVQVNSAQLIYMYNYSCTYNNTCTVRAHDSCSMSKRTDLSLSDKLALLEKIYSQPCDTSQRWLSELLGVPKSIVAKLIKDEPVLTRRWTQGQAKKAHVGHRKRKRDGKDPEVEETLSDWFSPVLARRSVQLL